MTTKRERQYQHERQPLLPMSDTDREQNRRDSKREKQQPEQLPLLEPAQRRLF